MTKPYKSTYFSKTSVKGSRAFAYYLSDYIFDELAVEEVEFDDIRVGDVLELYDEDVYGVVVDVDDTYDEITYVTVNTKGKVSWDETIDIEDLEADKDTAYSRYLTTEKKLSNGKSVTTANVKALLNTVKTKDAYQDGAAWDMSLSYTTELFGKCKGDKAFAAKVSDEVFDDLDDEKLDDVSDVRAGDVVYLWQEEIYAVVTDVYTRNNKAYFRYACADDGDIVWDISMLVSELKDGKDEVYTRYP